jgi:hypothetical protein
MMPTEPQNAAGAIPPEMTAPEPAGLQRAQRPWYRKVIAVLFATACLEIGFFLLVFPWSSYSTDFAAFRPEWQPYWDNPYVRGAISGLGLINLYISLIEILHLRRN